MKIIRRPIRSSNDPADTYPWAHIDVAANGRITIHDFNGLKSDAKHANIRGKRVDIKVNPAKADQPHALIVALDGDLRFVPFDEQPEIVYAHLAFYYPATDTLEVLEFIHDPKVGA